MTTQDRYTRVHPEFKLNGKRYTISSLLRQARIFVEEGEPYEEAVGLFILDWLNDKKNVRVHTSGSTGTPKLIKIKKLHMVNSAQATAKHFNLPVKTTALLCLPAHYIAGKMMMVRAMVLGWHIDMTQPKSNPLDNVYRRYDFCAMTPFQLDNSFARLHLLKKMIIGGGTISPSLQDRLQDVKTKVYETYGMTETVTHIAARRINSNKKREFPIPFKALRKVTVSLDERNCLIIKAPQVSVDPVVTNDIVEVLTFKKFIWLGRIDNVINSGGLKLHPEQIERKLAPFIHSPFFVAGIPDDILGEKLVLLVEQEEDFVFSKADDLSDFNNAEIPKIICTLPKFERTANGKLQRDQTVRKAFAKAFS